jgi:SOUL heme-binding protein
MLRALVIIFLAFIGDPTMAYEEPKQSVEEPRHSVLEAFGAIEIRQYEPSLMAEVTTTGDRAEAINAGFRILAGYIFGGNKVKEKVAMTALVTREPQPAVSEKIAMTAPVTQEPVGEKRWRVAFMMPSKYTLETLPVPSDERITFTVTPAQKRVAIRFSGLSTQSNLNQHRALLEAFVRERELQTTGPYALAFYDSPFTLPWNRRNEWWVPLQ